MALHTRIICTPSSKFGEAIRALFRKEAANPPVEGRDPLEDTNFDVLLGEISQAAFMEGVRYKKRARKYIPLLSGKDRKKSSELPAVREDTIVEIIPE